MGDIQHNLRLVISGSRVGQGRGKDHVVRINFYRLSRDKIGNLSRRDVSLARRHHVHVNRFLAPSRGDKEKQAAGYGMLELRPQSDAKEEVLRRPCLLRPCEGGRYTKECGCDCAVRKTSHPRMYPFSAM